ncbi:MAG: DUF4352 domain-containing protein [Eubacterium sp.]|nr:DUF4352 domain-containing protein [Eubacterium sp.]
MKLKRIAALFLTGAVVFSLSACMEIKDISDKKSDLVAEYAAGALLRNSTKYEKRLITQKDKERQEAASATATPKKDGEATPSPTPSLTAAPTGDTGAAASPSPGKETSPEASQTQAASTENQGTAQESSSSQAPSTGQTGQEGQGTESLETNAKLEDIYGKEELAVTYKSYEFMDKYRESSSQITASEGNTLLLVKFKVKNLASSKRRIRLGKKKIEYSLNVDGSVYKPGISILDNMGLNYLDTTLDAGKSEEADLVFEMSKDKISASSITLTVTRGDQVSGVKIK